MVVRVLNQWISKAVFEEFSELMMPYMVLESILCQFKVMCRGDERPSPLELYQGLIAWSMCEPLKGAQTVHQAAFKRLLIVDIAMRYVTYFLVDQLLYPILNYIHQNIEEV